MLGCKADGMHAHLTAETAVVPCPSNDATQKLDLVLGKLNGNNGGLLSNCTRTALRCGLQTRDCIIVTVSRSLAGSLHRWCRNVVTYLCAAKFSRCMTASLHRRRQDRKHLYL